MKMPGKCYLPQDMNKGFIESLAMQYTQVFNTGSGLLASVVHMVMV